ncbi:MAG: DUF4421 domain-containing protein [Prevotellaceae bacterium]|jgi:hypothetical protein|nr:DUF4421 domain-containing protein [Prevotellaceae bacterium]
MKRLSVWLCIILYATTTYAANPVSVKFGNPSIFKQRVKAVIEFDYSNAKVGKKDLNTYLKDRGENFVRDWPQDKITAGNLFITQFNKKNKDGLQIVANTETATYKIIVHVQDLDMGNPASSFIPFSPAKSGGCIMSGIIEIMDINANNIVCSLSVNKVKGMKSVSETSRIGLMYYDLAKCVCDLIEDSPNEVIVPDEEVESKTEEVQDSSDELNVINVEEIESKTEEVKKSIPSKSKLTYPRFHMGIRAGGTSNTYAGDGFAFPYGGIAMDFRIAPIPLYIETGFYYMNKGFRINGSHSNNTAIMPLVSSYHFYLTKKMSIQPFMGGYVGYGLDAENIDAGIRVGCGWNFSRLYVNMGYDYGLIKYENYYFNNSNGTAFITIGFNWAGSR